jgi:hypothetical protein
MMRPLERLRSEVIPARREPRPLSLPRLNSSPAGLTRGSMEMDCRVKPGNDEKRKTLESIR